MPLMVWIVNETGFPPKVMLLSVPVGPFLGSKAWRFRAPLALVMVKVRVFPVHASEPNLDEFLPSSQVNICNDETMGMPRL